MSLLILSYPKNGYMLEEQRKCMFLKSGLLFFKKKGYGREKGSLNMSQEINNYVMVYVDGQDHKISYDNS